MVRGELASAGANLSVAVPTQLSVGDATTAAWALSCVSAQASDEIVLPGGIDDLNIVLNRRRLAQWLCAFEQDCDVKDFLTLDALSAWLHLPISSTGLIEPGGLLTLRPFRLWEYVWLYKALGFRSGGRRILDIGGPASHLTMMAALAGNHVVAIDINPDVVAAGELLSRKLGLSYEGIVADGRDLSRFIPESFDCVVCCSVIEHIEASDQIAVLEQSARVLKPGGLMGMTLDYGPSAAGMNEHLPPPHDPPGSPSEVLRRYEAGDLRVRGNRDIEAPIDFSLFRSDVVRYTMASLILSRPPYRDVPVPRSEPAGRGILDLPSMLSPLRDTNRWVRLATEKHLDNQPLAPIAKLETAGLGAKAVYLHQQIDVRDREIERIKAASYEHAVEVQRQLTEAANLRSQLALKDAEFKAKEAELSLKGTAFGAKEAEFAALEARSAALEAELAAKEAQLREYQQQLDEATRQLAGLRVELDVRDEEIRHWTELGAARQQEFVRLQSEFDRTSALANAAQAHLEETLAGSTLRQRQIEDLEAQRSEADVNLARVRRTNRKLRRSLKKAEADHAALTLESDKHAERSYTYQNTIEQISRESAVKFFVRRVFNRLPAAKYGYVLHPIPPLFSFEAVAAFLHGRYVAWTERQVSKHAVPAIQWPRITVVTPSFNSEAYIERAIESVLGQHYPNLEYFVEDGGSTDGTMEIVSKYKGRLQVTNQHDNGMYDAIGRGFAKSTGEILCYLNSDDTFLPGALHRVGEYFARHPKAKVIYHEDIVDVNGWRYPNVAQPHVGYSELSKGHILFQDGVFFRRSAYQRAGGIERSLRLAGDWDLWTRMSARFKFTRMAGHVSCFFIRAGQLSSRMNEYKAEMESRKPAIASSVGLYRRLVDGAAHAIRSVRNAFVSVFKRDRLFFPIDFSQMPPPPGQVPEQPWQLTGCPITGAMPDRLLFSSRDTRFGFGLINQIYYVPSSGVTTCYPPLSQEFQLSLYNTHYSQTAPHVQAPDPKYGSPYRSWRQTGLVLRFVRNILAPVLLSPLVGLRWGDTTQQELLNIVDRAGLKTSDHLRFLDVGCFEGVLLDSLRQQTQWSLVGVEPNPKAVEVARDKGHQVYTATAQDVAVNLPASATFDIIFLGQVIEHLDDPKETIQRLVTLLNPGGLLILSTPNLDSKQIELFGPTWSHWHPPYHRFVFNKKALRMLGESVGLTFKCMQTYSHPYWTALSLWLNILGLGAAVPHGIEIPSGIANHARSITTWSKLFWDWRGKGDYTFVAFKQEGY